MIEDDLIGLLPIVGRGESEGDPLLVHNASRDLYGSWGTRKNYHKRERKPIHALAGVVYPITE